jgi:hypothetical protein
MQPASKWLAGGLQVAGSTLSPPSQHPCAKFSPQALLPSILFSARAHASWQSVDGPGHGARQDSALRFVPRKPEAVAAGFAYSGASLPSPGARRVAMI